MPYARSVVLATAFGAALFAPAEALARDTLGTTATYYHPSFHGSVMANGESYNRWDPGIAACNWYPLGTLLRVTHRGTGEHLYVRVKDRGSQRLTLDLSEAGFRQLAGLEEGRIPVLVEVISASDGQQAGLAEDLRERRRLLAEPTAWADAPPVAPSYLDTTSTVLSAAAASEWRPDAGARGWHLSMRRRPRGWAR
jgi:rare lipoprotein A (peptidoglycan hydrolase)